MSNMKTLMMEVADSLRQRALAYKGGGELWTMLATGVDMMSIECGNGFSFERIPGGVYHFQSPDWVRADGERTDADSDRIYVVGNMVQSLRSEEVK